MYAYKINNDGYIIDNYIINGDVDIPEGCITVQLPQPLLFYSPKWADGKWVEGATEEEKNERESQQMLDALKPSLLEIAKAERELETIELLMEMEVI